MSICMCVIFLNVKFEWLYRNFYCSNIIKTRNVNRSYIKIRDLVKFYLVKHDRQRFQIESKIKRHLTIIITK